MRPLRPTGLRRAVPGALIAVVLGAGAAGLASCGNQNGLLTSGTGSSLEDQLNAVSDAVSAGRCGRADTAALQLQQEVASLPRSVDRGLRDRLAEGAATLRDRVGQDCRQRTATPPTVTQTIPTQTLTTPTQTETTQTETTQTETTPTVPTTPTTTTPTSPTTTAPSGGGDSGSGGGASPVP